MDAFDADVLIHAAAPGHRLGRRVRALFPEEALATSGALAGIGSVLLIPELLTKPMRDGAVLLGSGDEHRVEVAHPSPRGRPGRGVHRVDRDRSRVEHAGSQGEQGVDEARVATKVVTDAAIVRNRSTYQTECTGFCSVSSIHRLRPIPGEAPTRPPRRQARHWVGKGTCPVRGTDENDGWVRGDRRVPRDRPTPDRRAVAVFPVSPGLDLRPAERVNRGVAGGASMNVVDRYARALERFGEHVHHVGADQWHQPTPCDRWDVRDLVQHLVYENCRAVELFAGSTIADVGDRLDGDLLGDDPMAAWDASAAAALGAVRGEDAMTRTVHLSSGDVAGAEYAEQLFADLLVHGWDLARAVGTDETLDADLVEACASWFEGWQDGYRAAGVIAAPGPEQADPAGALLAAFGRDASPDSTLAVLRRFNEAFNAHDVDAVMALMTPDCVFEDTVPPGGGRHEGQDEVRRFWDQLVTASPAAHFTTEEGVVHGERATYRWRYSWDGGYVRGVDVFRVRDGKVAEKLSYVKG